MKIGLNSVDSNNSREVFRKLTNKSSYSLQFGEPPKAAEDYVILKSKKFGDLEISNYVQELPKKFLEKWLSLNNQDEFVKHAYFVTREMHTVIKNAETF